MSHLRDRADVHDDGSAAYPPAPWPLVGQMWLSLFRLREPVEASGGRRAAGLYGVAFVGYEEGSPLTYSELLVARALGRGRAVEITDIWVDSPASMAGGRELWAIPKGLSDFTLDSARTGPLSRTSWAATAARRPIASADFVDLSRTAPRLPFRGLTRQPGIEDTGGEERSAALRGTARMLPCRGRWDFAADGPLDWLARARPLASCRMADFRLSFG
jgi:acetoacetate decarboxylase